MNGTCISGASYAASYPVLLSGTTFSLAFGTTTANSWSALQTFSGGASTTNVTASGTGYFGNGAFTATSGTTTIASGQGFTVGGTQLVVQQGTGSFGVDQPD